MRKKLHGAGDALGSGLGGVDPVAAVVVPSAAEVPAIDAVDGPRALPVWGFMNEYLRAGRREGSLVVIEGAVELRLRRQSEIDAGGTHKVQRLRALIDEPAP
jgi:hypothetical protein